MSTLTKATRPPTQRSDVITDPGPRATCGCLVEALEMTQWECSHNRWTRENTGRTS